MYNGVVGSSDVPKSYRQKIYGMNFWRPFIVKSLLVACHAQIWSYFVQLKQSTTPTSVNHVTKKIWSSFLCFNVFERFWHHLISFSWVCPWFLIVSVGQTLRPLQNPKVLFRGTHPCQHTGVRHCQFCEDPTQGFDFVEPETWYNKKTWTEKNGVGGLDFVENAGSDLTPVLIL